jgi:2-keto-4-pentenoate hydratase/2-oxohepta-3-ene-1,7-dioic acid hydratase in catechol pathway
MTNYAHTLDAVPQALPVGKVLCVGRNYAEHARELNNPVPSEPVLFIKPATALINLEPQVSIPLKFGACHFETEMAVLIADSLTNCNEQQAASAIVGVAVALDLTLRDLQSSLKEKSLPWEKAKAFDGACPISAFVSLDNIEDLQCQQICLYQNGALRQDGNSADMLTPVLPLLVYISQFFTLSPGDIVLTGTPAGVGPLTPGDRLEISLGEMLSVKTEVVARN